jgi:hypothetical protein
VEGADMTLPSMLPSPANAAGAPNAASTAIKAKSRMNVLPRHRRRTLPELHELLITVYLLVSYGPVHSTSPYTAIQSMSRLFATMAAHLCPTWRPSGKAFDVNNALPSFRVAGL